MEIEVLAIPSGGLQYQAAKEVLRGMKSEELAAALQAGGQGNGELRPRKGGFKDANAEVRARERIDRALVRLAEEVGGVTGDGRVERRESQLKSVFNLEAGVGDVEVLLVPEFNQDYIDTDEFYANDLFRQVVLLKSLDDILSTLYFGAKVDVEASLGL